MAGIGTLSSDKLVAVKNIAHWGDTLAQMLKTKQYLAAIAEFRPDWFILSGGGNDLQDLLSHGKLVEAYDPARPIDQCLTADGLAMLKEIAGGYRSILAEISSMYPKLTFICYAYDYPRPTWKSGKYIGQYLKKMNYPKATWDSVAKVMIDRLTASAGFKALAHRFEQALGVARVSASKRSQPVASSSKYRKSVSQGRRSSPRSAPKSAPTRRKRRGPRRAHPK